MLKYYFHKAMKRHLFIFTCSLVLCFVAEAQNKPTGYEAEQNMATVGTNNSSTVVRSFDNRYQGMRGSPYLLSNWTPADITYANNKTATDVLVKYDVYSNQLVMRRPQGDSVVIISPVSGFLLKDVSSGKNRVFSRFNDAKTDDPSLKEELLEVLYEGKTALLIRYDKTIQKASYQGAYSANRPYDELQDEKNYYLRKPDQTFVKTKLNKKQLLDHLTATAALKKWVDTEKLDLKKEADVVRLLKEWEKTQN
jgi:hypothetical protein